MLSGKKIKVGGCSLSKSIIHKLCKLINMAVLNEINPNPSLALLLFITTTTTAIPHNDLPSRTLTAPLQKRTGPNDDGDLHLSSGVIAGIVVGVLAIVAISIVLCCPCWKWIPRNKARAKSLPGPEWRQDYGGGMQELDVPQRVGRGELSEEDGPPRYEEFGGNRRENIEGATTELDSKEVVARPGNGAGRNQGVGLNVTMVKPVNEMPGLGMEHEMDGGGRGEWVVSPMSATEGGRSFEPAHLR
jgi:hypothetical protein